MGEGLQVLPGPWLMLGVCSLSVLWSCMRHCSSLLLWMEKERSRIRAVQMDNLRGLLGIRRIDKVSNAQTRELCRVMKGLMKAFSSGSVK